MRQETSLSEWAQHVSHLQCFWRMMNHILMCSVAFARLKESGLG